MINTDWNGNPVKKCCGIYPEMIGCPHCGREFDTREANSVSHEHKGSRLIVYFCEYCNKLVNGGIFEIKKGDS